MLLRTGMSAKQAVIYSGISTLLCFAGLPVGIVLGNIQDASLWIFAIIAGMFLYIALVDMVSYLFWICVIISFPLPPKFML